MQCGHQFSSGEKISSHWPQFTNILEQNNMDWDAVTGVFTFCFGLVQIPPDQVITRLRPPSAGSFGDPP